MLGGARHGSLFGNANAGGLPGFGGTSTLGVGASSAMEALKRQAGELLPTPPGPRPLHML